MRLAGYVLAIVLAVASAALAAEAKDPFNVDVQFGWQGCVRPMEWTPVEIGIQASLDEHFDGVLTVSNLQGTGATMTIRHPFVLTRGEPYYRPVVTKFAFGAPECGVAIHDARGRTCWGRGYTLWDYRNSRQAITVVTGADLLIGTAGRNTFGLTHLAKGAHSQGMTASHYRMGPAAPQAVGDEAEKERPVGQVFVKEKMPRYLPWDWTAYASLDLLVLYDLEWSALRPEQSRAIVDWVSGGGRLLLILGTHPLPANHPLAAMVPYRIGPARRLGVSREALAAWGCAETDTDAVTAWSLEGGGDARWQAAPCGTEEAASASGPFGFGRVGLLAFDPAALGGRQRENLAPFWIAQAAPLLDRRTLEAGALEEKDRQYYTYEMDETGRGTTAVLDYLLDIPEMQPISIGWVVLLLVGLAVVIGPVDYLVLKRYDRLPLTWLTFAAYIGLFSAGAYYGVAAMRSGPAQVRAVTVTDIVQDGPGGWSCCYSGLFAPASDAYRLDGLGPRQWWSAVSPLASDYLYAYQQEGGFRRQFVCVQEDGGNLPVDVPVSIWSMQCMMTEGPAEGAPLRAEVEVEGDRARARIENRSDRPILRGCVYLGKGRGLAVGRVGAGDKHDVEGTPVGIGLADGAPGPWVYDLPLGEEPHAGGVLANWLTVYLAGGIYPRTRAIEAYLARGDAVVCVEYDGAPPPYRLAGRRAEAVNRWLVRVVVTPRTQGATEGAGP